MAGELINPAIQYELTSQFGIVFPEFVKRTNDPRQYTLANYSSQEGYVRLQEAINVFGERTRKPEGFVEYVVLGDEEKTVARREGHFDRRGGSKNLSYAEVNFIQGDILTAYETPPYQFEYDGGRRTGEKVTGGTISIQVEDIADLNNKFDLMRAFYARKGRLFTLDLAYGDRGELRDYIRKKRQQEQEDEESRYAGGVFGGLDLSFPGVEFRMPKAHSSEITLTDRRSTFLQRGFSDTFRIGERVTPKETEPYAYEADRQGGRFIAQRIDTASGSIWTASTREKIDFMKLYTKSTSPERDWTTVRQDFPVRLEMK